MQGYAKKSSVQPEKGLFFSLIQIYDNVEENWENILEIC